MLFSIRFTKKHYSVIQAREELKRKQLSRLSKRKSNKHGKKK